MYAYVHDYCAHDARFPLCSPNNALNIHLAQFNSVTSQLNGVRISHL